MSEQKKKPAGEKGYEILFWIMLTLYVLSYLIARVHWMASNDVIDMTAAYVKLIVDEAVEWLAALYAGLKLADAAADKWPQRFGKARAWLFLPLTVVIGAALRVCQVYSWRYSTVLMAVVWALGWRKDMRRITRLFMYLFVGDVIVAMLGLPIGLTHGRVKIGDYGTGYAFGMTYPNTWARVLLLAVMLVWAVYLQKKKLWTLVLFWVAAIPVQFAAKCRTISLLMLLFPLIALAAQAVGEKGGRALKRAGGIAAVGMPFLCLLLTLLLVWRMESVHALTYGNYLRNMGKRFVQAGMALREYGMPPFGTGMDLSHTIATTLNGQGETLYVVDNGFVSQGVGRGLVWLLIVLCAQSAANWRAIKDKEFGLLAIGITMSLLTLMEREGLYVNYNFLLFYPMAKACEGPLFGRRRDERPREAEAA